MMVDSVGVGTVSSTTMSGMPAGTVWRDHVSLRMTVTVGSGSGGGSEPRSRSRASQSSVADPSLPMVTGTVVASP